MAFGRDWWAGIAAISINDVAFHANNHGVVSWQPGSVGRPEGFLAWPSHLDLRIEIRRPHTDDWWGKNLRVYAQRHRRVPGAGAGGRRAPWTTKTRSAAKHTEREGQQG